MHLSFTFTPCIPVLWPFDIHCTYLLIYIYIYICWCMLFTYLSMCCFFFLFIHMFLIYCMQSFIFLFHTKMPWWVLFKVFQKYRLSKSFLPWTLFLRSFSRVCVRIDFIVFNKWVWVEWFMTSLICSFVCCGFITDCQRVRLLGHMWIMLETYVLGQSFDKMHFACNLVDLGRV